MNSGVREKGGEGYGFPLRFKIKVSDDPDMKNSTIVVDRSGEDFANPGLKIRWISESRRWRHAMCASPRLCIHSSTASDADPTRPNGSLAAVTDGYSGNHRLIELPEYLDLIGRRGEMELEHKQLLVREEKRSTLRA